MEKNVTKIRKSFAWLGLIWNQDPNCYVSGEEIRFFRINSQLFRRLPILKKKDVSHCKKKLSSKFTIKRSILPFGPPIQSPR